MAVENLQGELQRVTRTIDLRKSLVNGCVDEFAGNALDDEIAADFRGQSLIQKNQPRIKGKRRESNFDSCHSREFAAKF
jgi:hypothetical protein